MGLRAGGYDEVSLRKDLLAAAVEEDLAASFEDDVDAPETSLVERHRPGSAELEATVSGAFEAHLAKKEA
jgi:hypothetical protein